MKRYKDMLVVAVLIVFTVFWVVRHFATTGDDLSSSYIGCQIISSHQATHLYSHDPFNFNLVADPLWAAEAAREGFRGTYHPYVQTPLWAFALQPLCTRVSYPFFCRVFLVLVMLCFSGMIWVVTRYWVPKFHSPLWIGLICTALFIAEPFRYSIQLVQTHIIFVLLSIIALVCARRYPIVAGLLLAVAAEVKITPGFLVVYWALTRQWKAALSFVGWSMLLVLITVTTTGPALMIDFLHRFSQTSNVLLVSWNNQSFAGWWMGRHYPSTELHQWYIHRLPPFVKAASLSICLLLTAWGGLIDGKSPERPPCGAALTLVAAMILAPIAWSHYYFLLLVPVLFMGDSYLRQRSWVLLVSILAVLALNVDQDLFIRALHLNAILPIYSQFYAGLLALLGMVFIHYRKRSAPTLPPNAVSSHVVRSRQNNSMWKSSVQETR